MTTPRHDADGPDLELTGERTLPGIADETYWYERHVVAYRFAASRAAGRTVLDAGCGEGYGAAIIAGAGAASVSAVDLDPVTVDHVRRRYPQVEATVAELGDLSFPPASFDLVVSFQVIEHVWDVPAYLASLRRVLRPGGELLVSTPNRLTFTPDSDVPVNPFHVTEFSPDELRRSIADAGLQVGALLGVHHGVPLRAIERAAVGLSRLQVRGLRRPATDDGTEGDGRGRGGVGGGHVVRRSRTRNLPEVLAEPPTTWNPLVRRAVHWVRADWFELRADRLEQSLDLLALCRTRRPGATGGEHDRG